MHMVWKRKPPRGTVLFKGWQGGVLRAMCKLRPLAERLQLDGPAEVGAAPMYPPDGRLGCSQAAMDHHSGISQLHQHHAIFENNLKKWMFF